MPQLPVLPVRSVLVVEQAGGDRAVLPVKKKKHSRVRDYVKYTSFKSSKVSTVVLKNGALLIVHQLSGLCLLPTEHHSDRTLVLDDTFSGSWNFDSSPSWLNSNNRTLHDTPPHKTVEHTYVACPPV